MRRWIALAALGIVAVAAAVAGREAVVGLRLAFVLAASVPIGAVVLLAIARLTGADWAPLDPLVTFLPAAAIVGLIALSFDVTPRPAHLATWSWPAFVGLRALLALGALILVGRRLISGGTGTTFAGLALAGYALLVTPIAADWLLAPGHGVSAIGMMLAVQQIGAACAAALVVAHGSVRFQRDIAALLAAAMLGLGYLAYMDYLIVWFGNLPEHVPFYVVRVGGAVGWLPLLALLSGVAGTIACAASGRGRAAGACAALGIALFDIWWLGAGSVAAVVALLAVAAIGGATLWPRIRAHG